MIVKRRQLETVAEAERDKMRYLSGPGWRPQRGQLSQARDAGLLLDQTLSWRESIWTSPNDHDHCRICWATIAANENTRHFAASPTLRVCAVCFASYVQPRKIDFSGMGSSGKGGPAASQETSQRHD
jgi:hypothetical protein